MKMKRSPLILLLLVLVGALLGSALWSFLSPILPSALTRSFSIGSTAAPWTVDLLFITLTLGIVLSVNIGSLIGMIIAIVVFYNI
ncbi:MAG: DUF4321 domain-containing protein [Clostridiales bacterium]|nr:DUF4321 domain-containing protein [Clostridiales bacterium]MBQ2818571.1 DUF4321 domain-containing protein [Clostridia bacterium]